LDAVTGSISKAFSAEHDWLASHVTATSQSHSVDKLFEPQPNTHLEKAAGMVPGIFPKVNK